MGMLNFDARTVQPAVTLTPLPEGWYKVRIAKSNLKQTAKGDGGYLELQCEVLEGQYQGRILYWNLNLFNPSQQATEIAYKQLSAICHVIGVFGVQDQNIPDQVVPSMHNIPFMVWAVVGQGTQGPINNIRGCKDINGNDPGKQGQGPGQPMPMQQPPAFGGPSPQQGGWQAPGGQGGTAPAGWAPQPNQPATHAAPTGPGGQPWQAGQSQQPQANWQQPQGQPQGQPAPAWQQQPQGQPGGWQQQPPNQPAQQPGQWSGGQPTQPQQQSAPPNQGWQQQPPQGGQPAAAPWGRG